LFFAIMVLECTMSEHRPQARVNEPSIWSRHEIKYVISQAQAAAIEDFIRPYMLLDHYCQGRPERAYPIVTLYLDSKNLLLCRESLTGQKNRFKLRIRSYTDEPNYPRYFEIKRRAGKIIIKSRARVLLSEMMDLLSGPGVRDYGHDGEEEALRQFKLYAGSIGARPVVRTRYIRRAFQGRVDKRVRITFDRQLCFKVTPTLDVGLNGAGWHLLKHNMIVLEIKFTGTCPAWIGRMTRQFNLRQQSVSKYARSIKRASFLGFCAPKVAELVG